jgi:hypothetical protein
LRVETDNCYKKERGKKIRFSRVETEELHILPQVVHHRIPKDLRLLRLSRDPVLRRNLDSKHFLMETKGIAWNWNYHSDFDYFEGDPNDYSSNCILKERKRKKVEVTDLRC